MTESARRSSTEGRADLRMEHELGVPLGRSCHDCSTRLRGKFARLLELSAVSRPEARPRRTAPRSRRQGYRRGNTTGKRASLHDRSRAPLQPLVWSMVAGPRLGFRCIDRELHLMPLTREPEPEQDPGALLEVDLFLANDRDRHPDPLPRSRSNRRAVCPVYALFGFYPGCVRSHPVPARAPRPVRLAARVRAEGGRRRAAGQDGSLCPAPVNPPREAALRRTP